MSEERLASRKNDIEIQDAIVRPVSQWNRGRDQQVRTQGGVEQPVAGIERLVWKKHLGDQPL